MTNETHLRSVPFKGNRTYIQGPDLVDLALGFFKDQLISRAKFSAHSFIRTNNVSVTMCSEELPHEGAIRGQVITPEGPTWLTITAADSKDMAPASVPFDETLVTSPSKICDSRITLAQTTPYSLTENIVSMQKALLKHLRPNKDGKWIFASVDYTKVCDSWEHLEVRIDHNFQNKLVKSSILVDEAHIGFLYFSLVSK